MSTSAVRQLDSDTPGITSSLHEAVEPADRVGSRWAPPLLPARQGRAATHARVPAAPLRTCGLFVEASKIPPCGGMNVPHAWVKAGSSTALNAAFELANTPTDWTEAMGRGATHMKMRGGKSNRVQNSASHSVQEKGRMKPHPSPVSVDDCTAHGMARLASGRSSQCQTQQWRLWLQAPPKAAAAAFSNSAGMKAVLQRAHTFTSTPRLDFMYG